MLSAFRVGNQVDVGPFPDRKSAAEWAQENLTTSAHGVSKTQNEEIYLNVYPPTEAVEAFIASVNGYSRDDAVTMVVPKVETAGEVPAELATMTNKALMELAMGIGITFAKKVPTKAEIIEAIEAAK